MPSFSERYNFKLKKLAQIEEVDQDLRISIWNTFYENFRFQLSTDEEIGFHVSEIYKKIWSDFLKNTSDRYPYERDVFFKNLHESYFNSRVSDNTYYWPWWKVYDFLEFVLENDKNTNRKKEFQNECNLILEKECSGYRFVNDQITPITSKEEIDEIEEAIQNSTKEVQIHLQQALSLLSDRESPDYRNSIKESISAVEAQCKLIAEDNTTTLGKALDKIERGNRVYIHPNLKEAFQKIYGWTNDDEGIRHALKDKPTVDQEDAQFMLIACSAFINYLHVKKMKAELKK